MAKLNGYYAVAVTKEGTGIYQKRYCYAIFDDGNVYKPGDQILVSGSNKNILIIEDILTPEEANKIAPKDITAEVICKVDISAYTQRTEDRKQSEELKKKMDAIIKKMDSTKKYEMYATENPELQKLLEKYKSLGNNL